MKKRFLLCLSIEILLPEKILSKAFQFNNVDLVTTTYLNQVKQLFTASKKIYFFVLPTVKTFLRKMKALETD